MKSYYVFILLFIAVCSIGSVFAIKVPVLTYHQMGSDNVSEYVTQQAFSEQMKWLYDNNFTTCNFDSYLNKTCSDKSFIITFDDGYSDDINLFKPIMDNYNFKGAISIVTTWVGSSEIMNWNQIVSLKNNGWTILSHSVDHKDLEFASVKVQQSEYANSQSTILSKTDYKPKYFIYPYNDVQTSNRKVCMQYYTGCSGGSVGTDSVSDLYLNDNTSLLNDGLVRIKVENTMDMNRFKRIFNYTNTINANKSSVLSISSSYVPDSVLVNVNGVIYTFMRSK